MTKAQRRLAFHALAAAVPASGALLSLAAALSCAWLVTHGTTMPRWLFAILDLGAPLPGEIFKKLGYTLFFAFWTAFLGLWFGLGIRCRRVIKAIATGTRRRSTALWFAAFSCLPLALIPALLSFGVDPRDFYTGEPLYFKDWGAFQLFMTAPGLFLSISLLVAAVWWLSTQGARSGRLIERIILLLFWETVLLLSFRIGLFPPPDGLVTDADTHHKSAVLEPLARYFVDGQTTFSLYGDYYVFGGTFVRLATHLSAEPFDAVQWFFILCLASAFGAFGLSLRLASRSWLPAFAALASAIAFARIPYRSFLYLQVEPIRWLFPSLTMLAVTLAAPALSAGRHWVVIPLFALAFAGLRWNLETGAATLLALSLATLFLTGPRTLNQAIRIGLNASAGLTLGWLGGYGLALVSPSLWPSIPQTIGPSLPTPLTDTSLGIFLKGMFVSEAPLFHAWFVMGLGAVWCVSFAASRLALRHPCDPTADEARMLGLLLFDGALFLLLLIYYCHLSVPSTLAAMSYPFFAACALAAQSALRYRLAPGGRSLSPFILGALAAAAPLLFLTPLLHYSALAGGHPPAFATSRQINDTQAICALVKRLAPGGEVLYLGQNDWWYELTCGQTFNHGLPPQSLILSDRFHQEWKRRLSQAYAVLIEADILDPAAPDHGRYATRLADYREILDRDFPQRTFIEDRAGRRLIAFLKAEMPTAEVEP